MTWARYLSHKVVDAAEITNVYQMPPPGSGWAVQVVGGGPVVVNDKLFARGVATAGDFLVRYDDGYLSWSPRAPFLAGYVRIPDADRMPAEGIPAIARCCHEAIRAWAFDNGDASVLPWDAAEEWQRASSIAGVEFLLQNPDAGPGASHVAWAAAKRKDGWTYGPDKDADLRTHPCLLPFAQLPFVDQMKDVIFVGLVRAMSTPPGIA